MLINNINLYIDDTHPDIKKAFLKKIRNQKINVYRKLFNFKKNVSPNDKIYYEVLKNNEKVEKKNFFSIIISMI